MAMDYLPIQASAVPCEHIFSSSSETDIKEEKPDQPAANGGPPDAQVLSEEGSP